MQQTGSEFSTKDWTIHSIFHSLNLNFLRTQLPLGWIILPMTTALGIYSLMIRPGFLPVGMSTSNRIIKPGYETYQPVIAARQFGLEQVPPHFHIYHLLESRADLPYGLTSSRCYNMFDNLHIPIPADLSFTSSSIGFNTWWEMWKTHVFRRALGPLLQQIDLEYAIPEEEVLNSCFYSFQILYPFA